MPLRATDPVRLDWDPSLDGSAADFEESFEWSLVHRRQEKSTLCWAACVTNALSCFGQLVDDGAVLRRYLDGREAGADDLSLLAPEAIRDVWKDWGFYNARIRSRALRWESLFRQVTRVGPVEAQLCEEGQCHVVLVFGVARKAWGERFVRVSDPTRPTSDWLPYEKLVDGTALPWGPWKRTYLDLGREDRYVRRFQDRTSDFLSRFTPPAGGTPPQPEAGGSPLRFAELEYGEPPDGVSLRQELAISLQAYRSYRSFRGSLEEAEAREPLYLLESAPLWECSGEPGFGEDLGSHLRFLLWHHQIWDQAAPRYYARCYHNSEDRMIPLGVWLTSWIGESWLARNFELGLRHFEASAGGATSEAGLILFPRHRYLCTLSLPAEDRHWTVAVQRGYQRRVGLRREMGTDELSETVAELA